MIKCIYFDNDECLSSGSYEPITHQTHLTVTLQDETIYTILRPIAKEVLKFARDLVGSDNVYMLTSASGDYANAFNEEAGLGFRRDQILAREDMERNCVLGPYGGKYVVAHPSLAHKDNVLIDNLPPRYNLDKMTFIGINSSRYLKVRDYYGTTCMKSNQLFFDEVKEFLLSRNSQ